MACKRNHGNCALLYKTVFGWGIFSNSWYAWLVVEPPLQPLPKAQEEQQQQRFLSETHPQSDNHCDKGYDGVFLYESMCLCGLRTTLRQRRPWRASSFAWCSPVNWKARTTLAPTPRTRGCTPSMAVQKILVSDENQIPTTLYRVSYLRQSNYQKDPIVVFLIIERFSSTFKN